MVARSPVQATAPSSDVERGVTSCIKGVSLVDAFNASDDVSTLA
jgi:hypothetical protein